MLVWCCKAVPFTLKPFLILINPYVELLAGVLLFVPFWIRRTKFSTCSKEPRRCLELRCYPAIQVPGPRNGTRCR